MSHGLGKGTCGTLSHTRAAVWQAKIAAEMVGEEFCAVLPESCFCCSVLLFVWGGSREAFDMQKNESVSCKHPAPDGPPDQARESFAIYSWVFQAWQELVFIPRPNLPLRSGSWPIPHCRLTWDVFVHPPLQHRVPFSCLRQKSVIVCTVI